jgi:hypothetical protein
MKEFLGMTTQDGVVKEIHALDTGIEKRIILSQDTQSKTNLGNINFYIPPHHPADFRGLILKNVSLGISNLAGADIRGAILIDSTTQHETSLMGRGAIIGVDHLRILVREMVNYDGENIEQTKALQYLSILGNLTKLENAIPDEDIRSLGKKFGSLTNKNIARKIISTQGTVFAESAEIKMAIARIIPEGNNAIAGRIGSFLPIPSESGENIRDNLTRLGRALFVNAGYLEPRTIVQNPAAPPLPPIQH